MTPTPQDSIVEIPDLSQPQAFDDPKLAVARLQELYHGAVTFLQDRFAQAMRDGQARARFRAFYPEVRITTTSFAQIDSRLSFGHVAEPGTYATTITRPDLFEHYLEQQIGLLIHNHGVPVVIGVSTTPMPVHFAMAVGGATVPQEGAAAFTLRDVFE